MEWNEMSWNEYEPAWASNETKTEWNGLRIWDGTNTKRNWKSERGESVNARTEEMELALAKLERRCRSAEKEVEAQKELINVRNEKRKC